MASIILIHGAFTGGWLWRFTAQSLAQLGHEVHRPTLTGCGERSHLLRPELSLAMHVQDVAQLLFHEDMERVVLVGHGYGGMIASALAHRHSARVAGVVQLDGVLPERGRCYAETVGRGDPALRSLPASADWLAPPPPAESFGLTCREAVRWLAVRLQPFPRACLTDPYPYGSRDSGLPCAFLRTTGQRRGNAGGQAARASLRRIRVSDLPGGPLPMVTQAGTLASSLSVLALQMAGAEPPEAKAGPGRAARRNSCRKDEDDM